VGILAYSLIQVHLAVLVSAYLVAVLLLVYGEPPYLGFTLLTQHGTDRNKQFHDHVLHQMVSLQEQVGVILPHAHIGQFLMHGGHLIDSFGVVVFKITHLTCHTLAHACQSALRMTHID